MEQPATQELPGQTEPSRPAVARGLRRVVYVGLGCFFVGLGALGVFLPVLPTTPFLLLASFFFIRSSPALNARLLRSRLFGGMLRDWHKHRGVRPHVKVTTLVIIPVVITASAVLGELSLPLVVLLCVLGLIGLTVVIRLPVVREEPIASKDQGTEDTNVVLPVRSASEGR
jgi:hypothetical protein